MKNKNHCLLVLILMIACSNAMAQYKAVITNLNNKEEIELKLKEEFYFGTKDTDIKNRGTLEQINNGTVTISGKLYKVDEITWIDYKGNALKKETTKISRILFYFGGGLIGVGAYEYFQANDKKTGTITGGIGAALSLGALCFWLLPKQPQYDFTTQYLLETVTQNEEVK